MIESICREKVVSQDYVLDDSPETKLRPTHYTRGSDTFAWAEERFNPNELRAIAEFNIHKYLNRLKGEDIKDFGKIADYALWIKDIKEKEQS